MVKEDQEGKVSVGTDTKQGYDIKQGCAIKKSKDITSSKVLQRVIWACSHRDAWKTYELCLTVA